MITVIYEERETEVAEARVVGEALWLSTSDLRRATGWTLRPEGLCHRDVCVPPPRGREAELIRGDTVDAAAWWGHAGHPVVHDDAGLVWVLGTGERARTRALQSL